jgi:hypothetical protein
MIFGGFAGGYVKGAVEPWRLERIQRPQAFVGVF